MKRLQILSLVALGGLVACQPAPEPGAQTSPAQGTAAQAAGLALTGDFKGPLGVQLYSFRDALPKDVPGTLARIRQLGFEEVETAGTYGLTPAQFRRELDRAGLRATAMHVPYERLRDSLSVVLNDAATLGARYVGVAWIPHEVGKPFTEEMARRAAADFNRWGTAARERGLQFFYHIHGYEFRPTPSGVLPLDVMMRETDPEAVKYELDVFWATHPGADPAALLRQYPGRWKLMHIKDMKKGTPTGVFTGQAPPNETEVPAGQGMVDWPAVLKAAEETGLERFYIEDETSDPFGAVQQSIRYLQTLRF